MPASDRLNAASELLRQIRHELETAKAEAPGRFAVGPGKSATSDVAAKLAALEEARKAGTPQERLDASRDYNAARAELEKQRAAFVAGDPAVKQLESEASKIRDLVRKAKEDADEEDNQRAAERAISEKAKREAKTLMYKQSLDVAGRHSDPSGIKAVGDETPLSAINARATNFIDKAFVLYGGAGISDYYNWQWRDAKETHFSIAFREVNDGRAGATASLFLLRGPGEDFADALIEASKRSAHRRVRLKATIPGNRYDPDSGQIMAEILDWQFLMPDGTWGPWASEVKDEMPTIHVRSAQ